MLSDLTCFVFVFFFFKQKTAYEMRISDWSSDVCSSDLRPRASSDPHPLERVQADALLEDELRPLPRRVEAVVAVVAAAEGVDARDEIGRASCRERVCQYV